MTALDPSARISASPTRGWKRTVSAYVALTKPRIIELLLVTTVPVMFLAERGIPSLWLIVATLVGGTLSAGAANTFNCVYDRDIDAEMHRTSNRPMVTGEISPRNGLVFGAVLTTLSTVWFATVVNALSAALSLGAIVMYAVGYTMILKRRTAQNIVWGGAAGCMPVLIGWAAVTNRVSWSAVILFLVIFFWTPPHYWPLSMRFKDDYAAAHVPMLPVVEKFVVVARQIVAYSWAMVAASLLLVPVDPDGLGLPRHRRRDRGAVHRRGAPPAASRQGGGGPVGAAGRCGCSTSRSATWRSSSWASRSTPWSTCPCADRAGP